MLTVFLNLPFAIGRWVSRSRHFVCTGSNFFQNYAFRVHEKLCFISGRGHGVRTGPSHDTGLATALVEGRPQPEATIHKLSFYVDESIAFAKSSGFA